MKNHIILILLAFFYSCDKSSTNAINPPDNPGQEVEMPPITGTPLLWGVDDAGATHDATSAVSKKMIEAFGFDLFVHHYRPVSSYAGNISNLEKLHDFYTGLKAHWILNLESANFGRSFVDEKGVDWYNHPDGRHYFQFPAEILQAISDLENKPGLMYDEAEHMQNCRNSVTISGFDAPFFLSEERAVSLEQAADNFTAEARQIARRYESYGLQVYSEHVFPIQYHTFAGAGFIPVSKILKENISPAYIACVLGATIQYNKPFWLTPDLWHLGTYPGHSVDTYRSALLLAYHMGAECIYTENLSYDDDQQGNGSLVLLNAKKDGYSVTEYGKVAQWFRRTYAPEHPRNYTYKELKPRVAIIRREDTCWGQSNSFLPDWLFGVKDWKSTPVTEAWFQIWHLLSNGMIDYHGLSWHNRDVSKKSYQLLFPLDGVVVFDETVGMEHLKDVELIFLTGLSISEATLNDVEECVRQGAVCVALTHLAPAEIRRQTGNNGVLVDGRGKWVVSESFLDPNGIVKTQVEPFLPKGNYIRYRFGNTEVKFSPSGGNQNKIIVDVRNISD